MTRRGQAKEKQNARLEYKRNIHYTKGSSVQLHELKGVNQGC